ncbi:MAG: autotransporter outer membrane beta-barrel domain-containing protein, partial [Deltaproteobacteria bacterium]|nr:autotransporter outer membrane beta-barrel domain-containing protein [Deltaproteobacteria bacterium]
DQFNPNQEVYNIDTVKDFEFYYFNLPNSVSDGFVALNATNIDLGTNATILPIDVEGGPSLLTLGSQITLVNATNPIVGNFANIDERIEGQMGIFFLYDYLVYEDTDGSIKAAVVAAPRINNQVKAITEASAARLAFVNQGQDFIAERGIELAKARAATENGIGVFAAVSGGKSRYDTGSHVDVSGASTLFGVSMGNYFDQNRLTVGVFGEFGFGSYESHTPAQAIDIDAEGDLSYVGGGLMARYDIQSSAGTLYLEGSGRIGNAKTEFIAKNVRVANRRPSYKTSGTYVGAHAGVGYDMQVTEESDIDVYFKYLWNKQNGGDERLSGVPFTLEDATSSRIRTGARLNYSYNDFIIPYVGGAYMYEFNGETDARAFGLNLPNADLKGSSAMAELGIKLLNSDTVPVSLDAGVQGYFGNRRGMSGSLDLKYEF